MRYIVEPNEVFENLVLSQITILLANVEDYNHDIIQ